MLLYGLPNSSGVSKGNVEVLFDGLPCDCGVPKRNIKVLFNGLESRLILK
jgi:hypothetical protein